MSEFGREPTPELAKKMMPLEKVRKVSKIAKEPVSLETPENEDSSLVILLKIKMFPAIDTQFNQI